MAEPHWRGAVSLSPAGMLVPTALGHRGGEEGAQPRSPGLWPGWQDSADGRRVQCTNILARRLQGRERNEKGQGKERDGTWYSPSLGPGQAVSPLVPSSCSLFS